MMIWRRWHEVETNGLSLRSSPAEDLLDAFLLIVSAELVLKGGVRGGVHDSLGSLPTTQLI